MTFDIDSMMESIQKGEDEQIKRPVRKKSELEDEAALKAREEEEEELKEALRADAVRGIKEDEYKRRFSRSIDDLIASRDQSYSAEPVQRADTEAFQRMSLFGLGKKKAPAPEPVLVRPKPKPVMAGAAPETEEEKAAREADEAAFQAAAKPAEARLDQPDARDSSS